MFKINDNHSTNGFQQLLINIYSTWLKVDKQIELLDDAEIRIGDKSYFIIKYIEQK